MTESLTQIPPKLGEKLAIPLTRRPINPDKRDYPMEEAYEVGRSLVAAIGDDDLTVSIWVGEPPAPIGFNLTWRGDAQHIPMWLAKRICHRCGYRITSPL